VCLFAHPEASPISRFPEGIKRPEAPPPLRSGRSWPIFPAPEGGSPGAGIEEARRDGRMILWHDGCIRVFRDEDEGFRRIVIVPAEYKGISEHEARMAKPADGKAWIGDSDKGVYVSIGAVSCKGKRLPALRAPERG